MIALAWLPAFAASVLATMDRAGEHELRCRFTGSGFAVTLHHPAASPAGEARRADHRHNLLEVVFLGRSERRDADHQLAFEWGDQLPDEESPWVLQANGEAAGVGVLAPVPPAPVALAVPDPFSGSVAWRGPPPPWRGLVMRV